MNSQLKINARATLRAFITALALAACAGGASAQSAPPPPPPPGSNVVPVGMNVVSPGTLGEWFVRALSWVRQ